MPRMTDSSDLPVPRPPVSRGRWNGFAADVSDKPGKAFHEAGNDRHRVRVEHDNHTVCVHLSDEDGDGWTSLVVDRSSRAFAVGQARTQKAAVSEAYLALYGPDA